MLAGISGELHDTVMHIIRYSAMCAVAKGRGQWHGNTSFSLVRFYLFALVLLEQANPKKEVRMVEDR